MSNSTAHPRLIATLALICLSATATQAMAADLDYGDAPPPVEEQKVEFGSGWYIRGDLGGTKLPAMHLGLPANLPTASNPTAAPDAPTATLGSGSKLGYVASLGGGYQFNHWIRADVVVDFHQPLSTTTKTPNASVFCPTAVSYPNQVGPDYGAPVYANGGCTGTYTSKFSSYDALVNGYIDLGTWGRFTPYIGAGIGVSFGNYSNSATYVQADGSSYNIKYSDPKFGTTFHQYYDRSSNGSYQKLAWALMGGVAVDVYDHTKLDVGYRYLNLGVIPGMSGSLTSQEVRAGLRYMIDD